MLWPHTLNTHWEAPALGMRLISEAHLVHSNSLVAPLATLPCDEHLAPRVWIKAVCAALLYMRALQAGELQDLLVTHVNTPLNIAAISLSSFKGSEILQNNASLGQYLIKTHAGGPMWLSQDCFPYFLAHYQSKSLSRASLHQISLAHNLFYAGIMALFTLPWIRMAQPFPGCTSCVRTGTSHLKGQMKLAEDPPLAIKTIWLFGPTKLISSFTPVFPWTLQRRWQSGWTQTVD